MRELYYDVYNWIKHPDEVRLTLSSGEKIKIVSKILILELFVGLLFLGLIYLIDSYVLNLDMPLDDSHLILIFLLMVVIAPMIEEFIFRFPLKYKRNYLLKFINYLSRGWLKDRWGSFFKYFLYLSVIVFGMIHLPNYNNSETLFFIISPILVGSQLIGGVFLSYTRIKLGFIWSILQHSAFNLVILLFGLIISHNQIITEESNEDFSIKIIEQAYVDKNETYYKSKFNEDTIFYIEANDISLSSFIDSLKIKEFHQFEDKWVDVKINSSNGMMRKELETFLRKTIKPEE
ncbi:CAAX prenyl protease-like protein [Gramella sp. Hel_I_59]|uniref:CPBP family intramembrane glutamic endopeptidase n=1 Tax=Gramella sp. Hel_I_59 TaxID=1249978 RepID=UPI00114EE81B|nr:CPBP family intramembrane glutamic endopeptidase [Gramella sp. Hel_I_59]TQI71153.1 CAAX prenyl protease-like protein [Gramella sp. Hel_I_59]